MYDLLLDFSRRPAPFSRYTAKELWTRPHLAQQMLEFHLNQDTDLASRKLESIDRVADWVDKIVDLNGKRVCDLGCGPGLYAQRFSAKGALVTGADFSANSLKYARSHSGETIEYIEADYLADNLPTGFDLITLIYTDFCVLSPEQRNILLGKIHKMLNKDGKLIMDVASTSALEQKTEITLVEENLMGGFWAPGNYIGMQKTYIYPDEKLALDRYLIIEPKESWEIFNWFQHFTQKEIETELSSTGFRISEITGDLTGKELTPESILMGVIATKS